MKKLIISILLIATILPLLAQNEYDTILKEIEVNSTSLNALREQIEAHKLANRTDIFLENPEVEFAYLWGSPSEIGHRINLGITQSFDFPTVYGYRNKISKLENASVELMYKSERMNLLLEAKQACIELVYYNALTKEYTGRVDNARQIAEAYKIRLDKGETNIIESNKAQLNFITVNNELERIGIEQKSVLSKLKSINGGKDIVINNSVFEDALLPQSFDEWYSQTESKSPVLQYVSSQLDINNQQIKLNKAASLPKLSAGYTSERVTGEAFQGVAIGVSIPLWENKNKVKQAKMQAKATETALLDNKVQFYNNLQNLYTKSSGLQQSTLKYRQALSSYNNNNLLKKALEAGEISLLEYLLEIEYYYDAVDKALESERDFQLSLAELWAVEL